MKDKKIIIGSDHGGFELKEKIIIYLTKKKYKIKDVGAFSKQRCDYPLIGFEVAQKVSNNRFKRGILICTSGIGQSIVANKLKNVRAALCHNKTIAYLSRRHNNANILVLGQKFTFFNKAKDIVDIWLKTEFEGGRHARRLKQIKNIEERKL
ncbi:MAG: ribose 5-phosphate isomerase B [Candidatus Gygaella obscura]|nr:ribose 5-phosphate isomerase B [Candidatus Gygaella obscura]